MKRALIISLYSNKTNYGNKLQNFATQKLLENLGLTVEVLRYKRSNKKSLEKISGAKIFNKFKKKILVKKIPNILQERRKKNFDNFSKNIKYTNFIVKNADDYKMLDKKYDYNFIGSDQIWGLSITMSDKIAFASFSNKNKNISLAASFGLNKIPKAAVSRYIRGLNNLKAISVREKEGLEIVNKLIKKDANLVCDPTLTISKEDWDKYEKKPQFLNKDEEFVLAYFVEGANKKNMKELQKKHNCKIISLNDYRNLESYDVGPCEFIYLVKHSKFIYTDSFHCCVFSIIYKKDFYVIDREDKTDSSNSRINTLLNIFKLEDRKINNISRVETHCHFDKTDEIILQEKINFEKFVNDAIK